MNYIYYNDKKPRLLLWVGLMLFGIGLILFLYLVKIRALQTRAEIAQLHRSIMQEEQELRLLSAELAYLQNPERLKKLAQEYLDLQPVRNSQIKTMNVIAELDAEEER